MDNSIKLKIKYEISQIDNLIDKSQILITLCKNKEPDFIEITSVGAVLHSFYNGIENILILIAKNLNGNYRTSSGWHKELVDFIFTNTDILNEDLRLTLSDYLGFRHFFRHTYGFIIQWDKCSNLLFGMNDFWESIKASIISFCEK